MIGERKRILKNGEWKRAVRVSPANLSAPDAVEYWLDDLTGETICMAGDEEASKDEDGDE